MELGGVVVHLQGPEWDRGGMTLDCAACGLHPSAHDFSVRRRAARGCKGSHGKLQPDVQSSDSSCK